MTSVPDNCPRVLINREKVGVIDESTMLERLKDHIMSKEEFEVDGANLAAILTPVTGLNFDDPSSRDVALIGECDNVIYHGTCNTFGMEDGISEPY